MPLTLPDGTRMAVAITVDFDAHSPSMGILTNSNPSALSRGEFGVDVGVPRLLDLFQRLDVTCTWPTPGRDLVTFPAAIEAVLDHGHEIAAHGGYHENIVELSPMVEYIPGMSTGMGDHRPVFQRWRDIFTYAYRHVPGAVYTLTVRPQTIGRAHHIAAFDALLTHIREVDGIWWATLSEIHDAWIDA